MICHGHQNGNHLLLKRLKKIFKCELMNTVEFKTVQASAIRILFESLKNILSDVNLLITEDGVKLVSMDGAKAAIVYLKLEASQFETYVCKSSIKIGINMISLFKILKSIKNNDVITFYIIENNNTELNIKIENSDKRTKIISVLKLLDIDEDVLNIPDIEFESVMTMPSNDFQTYITDLAIISNVISISSNETGFRLTAEGDFASQSVIIEETNNGLILAKKGVEKEKFNIKYIQLFIKSSNLCNTVEIYLKSKFPLTLVYNVANLGKLKYCLAPKI
jgi:proliferating cell nuclear antigen